MPKLALGNLLGNATSNIDAGLNFSALTALPSGRQSAVTTAANAAAATLSVTPQSIIDALSVGRGLCSMLPNDGCLLASSGGAVTVQGDPVGAIRSWTGVELATQSNASLRPVSGADGIVSDNTKWSEGSTGSIDTPDKEFFCISNYVSTTNYYAFSYREGDQWIINGAQVVLTRSQGDGGLSVSKGANPNNKIIFGSKVGTTVTIFSNGAQTGSGTLGNSTLLATLLSFFRTATVASSAGELKQFHWVDGTFTIAQKNAVEQFCKAYYGVTY